MHPGHHDPSPDPELPDAQLDFFHKLGYSTAQVQAVQQTFGATSDTDKMLGQLVRIGAGREAKQGPLAAPPPPSAPVTTMSVLVPRGDPQAAAPAVLLPLTGQCEESGEEEDALRPIVIDGSNVAMSHGNKEVFSCLGIQLSVNYFLDRGHTDVTVFVPSWRKEQPRPDVPITDQHILRDLERRKILVFTPSRRVAGKRVVCNDDCFIVKHGFESDGVVVSNDMYRDLQGEKPEWKRFIEERLLMYSFVNNKFMPPDDPLGRHGPSLENFLRKVPKTQKKQLCPYGKKCTYGIKCKFLHPERAKQSNRLLADELRESAKQPAPPPSHAGAGFSLLLVEHMAKKLTLNPESGPAKKSEPAKSGHRSGKKSSSRKEKAGQNASLDREPAAPAHRGSQDQLDSGLGSIDSQPLEAPWSLCDPAYGPSYGSCHGARQQYCRPQGAPCGSCSHSPPSLGPPGYHAGCVAPTCSQGPMSPYGPPPHYPAYRGYPVSMGAYSQPADFQHGRAPPPHHHNHQAPPYWSDPFPHHPVRSLPAERPRWEAGSQPKEREVVRKKLLAIFSAQLVDTAMDMFPQVMDPQVLVAEILALQSGNHSLR